LQVLPHFLIPTINYLKNNNNALFTQLVDLAVIDFPKKELRFSLNYILQSINYSININIIIKTDEVTPINSLTSIYDSANWSEREV